MRLALSTEARKQALITAEQLVKLRIIHGDAQVCRQIIMTANSTRNLRASAIGAVVCRGINLTKEQAIALRTKLRDAHSR